MRSISNIFNSGQMYIHNKIHNKYLKENNQVRFTARVLHFWFKN